MLLALSGPLRMLKTYTDSEPRMVSRQYIEVVTSDGHRVMLSRAAASLSDAWSEQLEEGDMQVAVPSRTLEDLCRVAEALVSRFFTPRPASASSSAVEILRSLSLPRRIDVLRAAKFLEFRTVARMAATAISEVLRGRSADVLRVVLECGVRPASQQGCRLFFATVLRPCPRGEPLAVLVRARRTVDQQ